jgi:Flp pilus assembly protein CpaB
MDDQKFLVFTDLSEEEKKELGLGPQETSKPRLKQNIAFIVSLTLIQYVLFKGTNFLMEKGQTHIPKVPILVSAMPLTKGTLITEEHITYVEIPEPYDFDNYFIDSEIDYLRNAILSMDLPPQVPILRYMVSPVKAWAKKPSKESHLRTYNLTLKLGSLGNSLKRGDMVDILAHVRTRDGEQITETLFEALKIVQINFENQSYSEASTLTFLLTADEINVLTLVEQKSRLSVILRPPHAPVQVDNMSYEEFLKNPKMQKIFDIKGIQNEDKKEVKKELPRLPKPKRRNGSILD